MPKEKKGRMAIKLLTPLQSHFLFLSLRTNTDILMENSKDLSWPLDCLYLKSFPCLFRAIVRLFGWKTVGLVAARLVDPKAIFMAFNAQVLWWSCVHCG